MSTAARAGQRDADGARRRAERSRLGRGTLALLVLVALAVGGAATAEVLTDPPQAPAAEPVPVGAPTSGAWYCPVTGTEEETAVVTVAAVEAEPSTAVVVRHRGAETTSETVTVEPGSPYELQLTGGEARFATTVRWSGGPVAASWRVEGTDTAGARCETAPAPMTYVTGFDTTAQSVSTLHLYNPYGVDAVARVVFGTPTGPVARVLTENILVPAEGTTTVALNDYEPEQPDLAVTVEVLTGRIVAQGMVSLAPTANQPGPTGRDVLAGSSAGLNWTFAYARADEGSTSWLSVYNPNEREAAVEVRVANPLPEGSALLGEVSIPAGGVSRVDLAETSASTEFGVTVAGVNEEPVVVSRLTAVETSGGAEGLAASPGSQPAPSWALLGGGGDGRLTRVALYNPGGEAAVVAVDAGAGTPPAWGAIRLEPNEHAALDLAEVEDAPAAVAVLVAGDAPITADVRVQTPGEALRFWTAGGVPSSIWEGPGTRPAVRRDARLSTRPAAVETPDPER